MISSKFQIVNHLEFNKKTDAVNFHMNQINDFGALSRMINQDSLNLKKRIIKCKVMYMATSVHPQC